MHPAIIAIAALPLIFRLVPFFVPAPYLEPYNYWSSESLNKIPGEDVAQTHWRNMGWWDVSSSGGSQADEKGTDVFPGAAEALARKLVEFADVAPGGSILDIAHGAGESLGIHLSSSPPPSYLHALTSLASETRQAEQLVSSRYPNTSTSIEFFTSSASYRPGKDLHHPLNPMRGYLGTRRSPPEPEEGISHDNGVARAFDAEEEMDTAVPPPYDLVYILDAIYHFPPSVPHFLASVLQVLRPGSGVVAYTDILPPPDLSAPLGHLILPPLLSVPSRNFVQRPKSLEEYQSLLERIGYDEIRIEDWSDGVWKGFAANLRDRGMPWTLVGRVIAAAERNGWKFIVVRARRPGSGDDEAWYGA